MAFFMGTTAPVSVQRLAIPFVSLLIAFLGYGSQWLFVQSPDLSPGPLSQTQTYVFNTLLACLWYTYFRTCSLDPGRFAFSDGKKSDDAEPREGRPAAKPTQQQRWCKKCAAPKPPRAHHCKHCKRCIPKMDHHCPWTGNCVSLTTFPHFLRFLAYANISLWTLLFFIAERFYGLWQSRHLPYYLGPTLTQLVMLTVFTLVAGTTSLALFILLFTTVKGWLFNTTMIEGWEIERHEAVLERKENGEGWWRSGETAPGGDATHFDVEPVEFPYELGIFTNMAQAMGTANFLLWFWPFAGGPKLSSDRQGLGWEWEENGFNDREGMWPPVDPEKLRYAKMWRERKREADLDGGRRWMNPEEEKEAFRRRQAKDLQRFADTREGIMDELEEVGDYDFVDEAYSRPKIVMDDGAAGWVNEDGEGLADFGVDEDAESDDAGFDDPEYEAEAQEDDEVPLAELIRRRKVLTTGKGEEDDL